MLSKNTVLRTRKAIEMSYDFRADIFDVCGNIFIYIFCP